jgi:hypothetical protein
LCLGVVSEILKLWVEEGRAWSPRDLFIEGLGFVTVGSFVSFFSEFSMSLRITLCIKSPALLGVSC